MERSELPMQAISVQPPLKEVPLDREQEFQQFYQENLGLIYRHVYNQVGIREEAEDLTSQIFLNVVNSIDHERSRLSMKKWLYLIARSIIADYWRARSRLPKSSLDAMLEAGWEGPAEVEMIATSSEAEERVERLLQALPEKYREVLKCRFLLKLSVKATALHMGVTEANVKVLQFRALKRAAELEHVIAEQEHRAL
jgi:RNA polymerase sigma-70 factor (ECF subfamily)